VAEAAAPDRTVVDLVYAESLDRAWRWEESERIGLMGTASRPVMTIDRHPDLGYLIRPFPHGRYLVAPDGRSVHCAPPAVAGWYWQRLLIGQVLPAVSALRGHEVIHASAVDLDGRVLAFAGMPGSGKSTIALRLMLDGATLVAEDVVSIRLRDGVVLAEPGASLLNIRDDEAANAAASIATLGSVLGRSRGKLQLVGERATAAKPLGALYLLERHDAPETVFERLESPGISEIMRNTYVSYLMTPERLISQLDLVAAVSRSVPVVRIRIGTSTSSSRLAEMVQQHAADLPSGR